MTDDQLSGLDPKFLQAMLDQADRRYDNRLQKQPFIFGCAAAFGWYKRDLDVFQDMLEALIAVHGFLIACEMDEAIRSTALKPTINQIKQAIAKARG